MMNEEFLILDNRRNSDVFNPRAAGYLRRR